MRRIAQGGADAFYQGDIAKDIIAAPRIHTEGCDPKVPAGKLVRELFADSRLDPETVKDLEGRGHKITVQLDGDFFIKFT